MTRASEPTVSFLSLVHFYQLAFCRYKKLVLENFLRSSLADRKAEVVKVVSQPVL